MRRKKPDTALYTLKIKKKGSDRTPLILQFIDRAAYDDTYYEIKFHRDDLEIIEQSHTGTMIFKSMKDALETADIFLR